MSFVQALARRCRGGAPAGMYGGRAPIEGGAGGGASAGGLGGGAPLIKHLYKYVHEDLIITVKYLYDTLLCKKSKAVYAFRWSVQSPVIFLPSGLTKSSRSRATSYKKCCFCSL